MQKICMVGSGYVGLVSGACLADFGNEVICVDSDKDKVKMLKRLEIPFYEFALGELVKRAMDEGRLSFSSSLEEGVVKSKVIFIAVGTPPDAEGEADVSEVLSAAAEIAQHMTDYRLIVQKSTVPVGTGARVRDAVRANLKKKLEFDVASNPEFLREGSAVETFMRPDRVVIGTWSTKAAEILSDIYAPLYLNETPMVRTTVETAELIKYTANAFLATKISFINEIANLCEKVGADVKVVEKAIGLDRRIGPKFLHAGIGFGGSCFPKDTMALARFSEQVGEPLKIVNATIRINQDQRHRLIDRIRGAIAPAKGKKVAVLGLSFKPNTDDLRDAPSLDIIKALRADGAGVRTFDPVAMPAARHLVKGVKFCHDAYDAVSGADAMVLVTEWNELRRLDLAKLRSLMKGSLVIDCRNVYDPSEMKRLGFTYFGVGRGTPPSQAGPATARGKKAAVRKRKSKASTVRKGSRPKGSAAKSRSSVRGRKSSSGRAKSPVRKTKSSAGTKKVSARRKKSTMRKTKSTVGKKKHPAARKRRAVRRA
jgi:UDPglucose 6-dehydrogenase